MKKSLIDNAIVKINQSDISVDPYPHFKIDNFFDEQYFSKMVFELKNLPLIKKIKNLDDTRYKANDIETIINDNDLKKNAPLAYEFNKFLSSKQFFSVIAEKIKPYAAAALQVNKSDISKSIKDEKYESSIHAIMPGKSVKRRGVHLDDITSAITFLLYVKFDDDYSSGGSIQLLSQEDRLSITSGKMFIGQLLHIYPTDMIPIKSYEYKNNTLFVQSNSQYSLHEVSTRRNAKFPRISFQGSLIVDEAKLEIKSNITTKLKSIFR